MLKLNFWKKKKDNKVQQAIPASWMRYMLKVLPDANDFYVNRKAPVNKIFYGMPDEVSIAGQANTNCKPRVECTLKDGKSVVFHFYEFGRDIEVGIVKSIEKVSYGGLNAEVETYLWDFGGLRVISDEGFSAVCRFLYKQNDFILNYVNGEKLDTIDFEKDLKSQFNQSSVHGQGSIREGERPEQRDENGNVDNKNEIKE